MTVDYATADGTATAPADYTATSGTLIFTPGQTTKTVTVRGQRRHPGRARRDLHRRPRRPRSTRRSPTARGRHDHRRRRPPTALDRQRDGHRGQHGHRQRQLHRHPERRPAARRSRSTTRPPTAPPRRRPTTRRPRHADLHRRPDDEDRDRPRQRRHARRGERDLLRQPPNPSNATIADGQGLGTITDDDPLPTVSINDVTVTEGNAAPSTRPSRSASALPSGETVSVDYATADGTATAPPTTGDERHAHLHAGPDLKQVTVLVKRRRPRRGERAFTLNLTNAVNVDHRRPARHRESTDDDPMHPLSVNDVPAWSRATSIDERDVHRLAVGADGGRAVTVDYATADGTAQAPLDYLAPTER